jgi:hypothetical protein
MYHYITFSIAICTISWIVGMAINAFLKKTEFYKINLSNLNFIQNKSTNKFIGIGLFKWVVKNTFFKFFNQKINLKNKNEKTDLLLIRNEMTNSEIDHLIGFGFVLIFALEKAMNHNFLFGLIILIFNLLLNFYPSLLQQENKRRLDRFLKKLQ